MKIEKSDLVKQVIGAHPHLDANRAREIVETFFSIIRDSLIRDERIVLTKEGKFNISLKLSRMVHSQGIECLVQSGKSFL